MNSNSAIKIAVRFALLAGAGAALVAPAAFGQDAAQAAGQAAAGSSTSAVQLGKIQVTGTRILRTNVETAQPITVVTAQEIRQSGLTTIGDVLQDLTQSGAALNTLFNNGGSGATSIDLRYFGSNRVLVLVNGRRWTSSLGGSVDLNNIPSAIIDHVEILQDGASAIYGSDAITGVVNIITVKNFDGAEANAYLGMYHNDYKGFNHWDGKQQSYNFTIGSSGKRWASVISMAYTEQDPVWAGSRAQSKEPIWTHGTASGASEGAGGEFLIATGKDNQKFGQATCGPVGPQSNGTCDMTLIDTPTMTPSVDNFRNYEQSDNFNYAPFNYFSTPLETKSVYLQGHYDVADNITFTAMGEVNVRTSQQILAPAPLGLGAAGFSLLNGSPIGIGADNPYNPFHMDLVANQSQFCPDGSLVNGPNKGAACNNNLLLLFLARDTIGAGQRVFTQHVTNYTVRMGLNGFFNALGNEWDWDVGSSYGNIYSPSDETGAYNTVRLATALNAPGSLPCNGPGQSTKPGSASVQVGGLYYPILSPGCVPFNFFGGYNLKTGQGSITPEMANYVLFDNQSINENTMRDYTANITGSLFDLPAGPLALAVGAEHLEEDGYSHPDDLDVEGTVDEGAALPTQGRQWTNAEYVEFNIPLISDVPVFKSLSLDLANRWSQFKWTGGEPTSDEFGVQHDANATTAQAKLRWQVTEDWLLRGSWSQGFRAPDLNDLYGGVGVGFPTIQDPCAPNNANGLWNPSEPLPPGCHGVIHQQPDSQIQTTRGGNPSLSPETAISRSVGFVYNPSWLPGFDISADYYKIDLGNSIGSLGPQFIMDQCYIQNDPAYCSRITQVGRTITDIVNTNANTGESYSRGVDLTAHYRFPATAVGNFMLSTNWTFVQSFVNVFASASSSTGFQSSEQRGFVTSGTSAIPQRKGNLTLNWNQGNWSGRWNIQYIGKVYEFCTGSTIALNECSEPDAVFTRNGRDSTGKNQLGTTIYHDVSVTYHIAPVSANVTFGIRNLFNKQYPAALTAFANSFIPSVGYRLPGRFFYANVGVKF